MVCKTMPIFGFEITPNSNTSNPSLNGTLTKFNLLKKGSPFWSELISVINSLAALLPISIAANLML